MNGGLASALEYATPDQIHDAVAGLRYLRLDDVAVTLATAFDVAFPAGAPTLAGYVPRHSGGRFSRNADIPSWASSACAFMAMTALVRS